MLIEYNRRRNLITNGLNKIGYKTLMPQGAFYVFPNIRSNSKKFSDNLLKNKKIVTIPGTEFGKSGENHIRMSYATSKDNIVKALDRIKKKYIK